MAISHGPNGGEPKYPRTAEKLRDALDSADKSQADLVRDLQYDQSGVSKMLNGWQSPSLATELELEDYLGVPRDQLVDRDEIVAVAREARRSKAEKGKQNRRKR